MKNVRPKIILERKRLADLLSSLEAADFTKESVLPSWSVKALVAHIALEAHYKLPRSLFEAIRHGSINRYMLKAAQQYSGTNTVQQLINEILANKDNFRSPPGITLEEVYIDLLLHRQDILLSLNRAPDLSDPQAEDILAYLPDISPMGKLVLRSTLKRLESYSFTFPDGTSLGHGNRRIDTKKSAAILIILGRITPKR